MAGALSGRGIRLGAVGRFTEPSTTLDLDVGGLRLQEPSAQSDEQKKFVFAQYVVPLLDEAKRVLLNSSQCQFHGRQYLRMSCPKPLIPHALRRYEALHTR